MKNVIGAAVIGVAMAATACAPGDPCEDLESGHACTWLGVEDSEGFNGDHLRWETRVNQVQDLEFLPDGTAWFTDFNNYLVRRVHPDGQVESMVGWTDPIFPGDGPLGGFAPGGGPGDEWQLNHPTNFVVAPDGTLILVAWHNHKLLEIDSETGDVRVRCGSGPGFSGDGGPAAQARFIQPVAAAFDDDGNLYVVDQQNQRVRRIDPTDTIETIAGNGMRAYGGDGGPAIEASFQWAFGSNPNPSGGIAYHDGMLYVSDTENHRVRAIDLATGIIDTFAGTGEAGDAGDGGPAAEAQLAGPRDLEIGPDGHLYIADTNNSRVRAIDLESGDIRTVVGTGELGYGQDGVLATEMALRRPFGVAFDPEGNLYVMDSLNSRIVKVAR